MKGIIIAGGECPTKEMVQKHIDQNCFIVCADRGYDYARKLKVVPHLVVGDMDSTSLEVQGCELKRFPTKKDDTDSQLAVSAALAHGCEEIVLFGASGTRLDHTLTNIMLLKSLLDRDVRASLIDRHNEIYITNQSMTLTGAPGKLLSLIPLGDCHGVRTIGLSYPLKDETLYAKNSRGVSNTFINKQAHIKVKQGCLLVIKSQD